MMNLVSSTGVMIVLPSPELDDTENNVLSVSVRRSMNNNLYTYVKNAGRLRLVYKFNLFRNKALELQAFITQYLLDYLRVTDYRGGVFIMRLLNDPFEFSQIAIGEITQITLNFEGVQVTADSEVN